MKQNAIIMHRPHLGVGDKKK
uniref:Uncharacterized protein n=1 Tax=Moniliophthora roreri TaxID=221103 RepID=A0A0W0FDM8_MONRR